MNDRNTQHAIRTTDERISRLLYKNSIKSANQSDAWNLKCWKLCNLSAHTWYHKSLWQNNLQAFCSHAESKKNINKNDQLSTFFHDRLNHHSSASRLQNQKNINKCENIIKIVSVIYFLFFLHSRAAWDMQQHQ